MLPEPRLAWLKEQGQWENLVRSYLASVSFADRQLEVMGLQRRVEVVVGSFTAVPWMLERTHRLALLHERLATGMLAHFDIALAEIPFRFPVMREMVQYHSSRAQEAGVAWLRGQLQSLAEEYRTIG